MKYPQDKAKLAALNQFIEETYGGQIESMVKQLYETIYMLHYLEPEIFNEDQIQDKVFLMFCMAEALSS